MTYDQFIQRLESLRPKVLDLVRGTEVSLRAGTKPQDIPPPDDAPFSSFLWGAYCQNTYKLLGVRRITGTPYATHPTRMAIMTLAVLKASPAREKSALFTIFHDYLEEGDGRTAEGVANFYREYPGQPEAVFCAVVLSEPEIDYEVFSERRKTMQNVAYVAQLRVWLPRLDESYANASLADKLDNIHDLTYITQNPRYTPEKKMGRLIEKFGYFLFVLTAIGSLADPLLQQLLEEAIWRVSARHHIEPTVVRAESARLERLLASHATQLQDMIVGYHRRIGLEPPP